MRTIAKNYCKEDDKGLSYILREFYKAVKKKRKQQGWLTWSNHIFLITLLPKLREATMQILMT